MIIQRSMKRKCAIRNVTDLAKNFIIVWLVGIIIFLYHRYSFLEHTYANQRSSLSFFDDVDPNPGKVRIDWHDYKFMAYEEQRKGLGEQGKKAFTSQDKKRQLELYKANGYDGYLSDLISVNRSVPDVRPKACKTQKYLKNLPTVSAIIPVYNEHFSIVMRTAHSILNRAQGDLVREIIFVNDKSDPQYLNSTFDEYVAENFNGRGRVLHLKDRIGLIQARMAGARVATSEVLLFADAHTEATINYLPPLLDPIAENYRVCTVPIEDALDVHNFEYPTPEPNSRAIFDWYMNYYTVPVLPEDAKDPSKPFKTPVMKGGLFAISAKFFWELDGYDDQLEIWGGEQYEISFKIWMCGGEMYMVPCSHFGHMFRTEDRPFDNPRPYNYIMRNYKRVIEVWMDDYKHYIYDQFPGWDIDAGPLLKQHFVREKLQCKSFKWYLETVAPDMLERYPVGGAPWFAKGEIRSVGEKELCVDTLAEESFFGLSPCEGNPTHPSFTQNFELSYHHDINQYGFLQADCADVADPTNPPDGKISKSMCHREQGNQFWRYDRVTKMLVHDRDYTYCMEANVEKSTVFLNNCNKTNVFQKWEWSFVNQTMLDHWDSMGAKLINI